MRSKKVGVFVVFVMLALIAGCIHRQGSTVPVTPLEKAVVYNDGLGQVNNRVAIGVIQANKAGIINDEYTEKVTRFQFAIANDTQQLAKLLAQGPEYAKLNAAKIQDLISDLVAAADSMVTSSANGIKNPQSAIQLQSDIGTAHNLASLITTSLHDAGILK